ncbi:MAG: archease [Dehalococcoidia bacterium]|nr:archease [Dehalococcoidia bacterium]MDW8119604.1 archease [Chloroflexota bacterium]
MGRFTFLEHTADVGVVAEGADLKEAFAFAGMGMFAIIADPSTVQEREVREVEVSAPDRDALLVDFLNELNFLFESRGFLVKRVEVVEMSDTHLRARLWGEPVDRTRHRIQCLIKSATYHALTIAPHEGGWRIQVILDV